jgi:hypothetical protein
MNIKILQKLTFGFEIEGYFKRGIAQELSGRGNFGHDGSVNNVAPLWEVEPIPDSRPGDCSDCQFDGPRRLSYCLRHHSRYGAEGEPAQEYASEKFEKFGDMLKDLKMFDSNNHIFNNSCGLHFHIGMKGDAKKHLELFSTAINYDFMRQLYKEAKTWCACQKKRLDRDSAYYRFWSNQSTLISNSKSGEKYSFIRFHPSYSTLEARFLSPCEHKVDNVKKILNHYDRIFGPGRNYYSLCDGRDQL